MEKRKPKKKIVFYNSWLLRYYYVFIFLFGFLPLFILYLKLWFYRTRDKFFRCLGIYILWYPIISTLQYILQRLVNCTFRHWSLTSLDIYEWIPFILICRMGTFQAEQKNCLFHFSQSSYLFSSGRLSHFHCKDHNQVSAYRIFA